MNAASILRNQSNHSNSSSVSNLSGMKTVLVGKDQQPVTIMQMAPVNESVWRKAASFDILRNTAHSPLLETHSIADVISLVSNKLPIDTGAAFQESQEVAKMVTGSALRVENLHPSAFLFQRASNLSFILLLS